MNDNPFRHIFYGVAIGTCAVLLTYVLPKILSALDRIIVLLEKLQ